jgi:stage II sporulation protein D
MGIQDAAVKSQSERPSAETRIEKLEIGNRMQGFKGRIFLAFFLFLFMLLLFWFLTSALHLFCTECYAETTIRVLLLDKANSKVPHKDELIENLGNSKGEVLLSGIKYSGIIEVWKGKDGLYIINEIPLEDYVKGVVSSEVGKSWDMEALKAQAVVARTYVLYQKMNNGFHKVPFDLTSSVLHQVYKGGSIPENIVKAVNDTRGEILKYEGNPIVAYYHSTSGGMTEDPVDVFGKSYPYLKSVEGSSDLSPYNMWERRIPLSEIEKALNISRIKEIAVDSYTASHRVKGFNIFTEKGEHIKVFAKELRKNLGWDRLPSTLITNIVKYGDIYIFEGRGYGHGVGMCQWTALQMAKDGKNYKEILSTFYPGAYLELYEDR